MVSPHNRRVFLAYSAQTVGALPTFLVPSWALADDAPHFSTDLKFKHLRPDDISILAKLLPIALGVELDLRFADDQKMLEQTLVGLDHLVDQLSTRKRENFMLLLTFLSMPLTRSILGLWTRWDQATRDEVVNFLDRWEKSALSLRRFGYQSLMQLMESAFHSVRGNTIAVGYPDVPTG
jgi:hypothetical protein